jgi:ubiquinone biosynthesis protein
VLPPLRHVDLAAVFDEFERTLACETDMRAEGRQADRFAFDFRDDERIAVPRVAWPLTGRRVLTMEYLEGWRLSELDEAARAGIDGEALARHGAVAFMRQVLVHGRFHADLHPANLFVTPEQRIAYLDFGIVGHLGRRERRLVARVLAAIVERDPEAALDASAELGLLIEPTRRRSLVRDLEALMERTLASQRDIKHFGIGLLSLLARHRVRIPVGYGLLVKALVTVEGVARALYPQIDIIETARPFALSLAAPARLYSSASAALRLPER